jgi:ribonuclease P protein component
VPARTVGRITSRAVFAELQRSRARGVRGPVKATFVPTDENVPGVFPQVGYAIGRRCGGAVIRNTLRRRARAVIQSEAHRLPRGSYLVRFEPGAAELAPTAFRSDLVGALVRAGRMAVSA